MHHQWRPDAPSRAAVSTISDGHQNSTTFGATFIPVTKSGSEEKPAVPRGLARVLREEKENGEKRREGGKEKEGKGIRKRKRRGKWKKEIEKFRLFGKFPQ